MDYEIPVYRYHFNKRAAEAHGEMWSNYQDYTTATNAASAARMQAEIHYRDEYEIVWEICLDEPVTTRRNRRMPEWEKKNDQ